MFKVVHTIREPEGRWMSEDLLKEFASKTGSGCCEADVADGLSWLWSEKVKGGMGP
jgi:hypothetical protein